MEITQEIALRIIESKPVIEQAMVPYKGIEVSHVGYTDADGEPFMWEDGTEYAIVNFKAVNEYGFEQSVADFQNEDYESAVNYNLSMRMSVDKAQDLAKGVPGTLVCQMITVDIDGVDTEVLMPKSYTPAQAIVAKKRSLSDILAKSDGVKATA
jgi:hypothetical protein